MTPNSRLVSVVIAVYNEEKVIEDCLKSLQNQSYRFLEIIVVDDGSTDNTQEIIGKRGFASQNWKFEIGNLKLLYQKHHGPGPARNLGAKKAAGEILVFVDADMTFDKNFIKDLTAPILKGETIGTFSKNEIVKNNDNIWSICWNINRNLPPDRMIPENYPKKAPVFRAITKKKFNEAGGFDQTGEYTDDWSLSRKLGIESDVVNGAIYYHSNPASLFEVWKQARWIGKNKFISGNLIRRFKSLILYSLPISLTSGLFKSITKGQLSFILFKLLYDLAITTSVIKSFLKEQKSK
ncbi:glycosyltransferase family 2 protein [Candidatus Curtissbacteria bacterium]|nr:glycosyltransferase family 2 protein [Candidatus Curtissbacteria bacterium]